MSSGNVTKLIEVLLVEDDAVVLETMDLLLQHAGGFHIVSANGYASGMTRLSDSGPHDVLVADVILLGPKTGIDLANAAAIMYPGIALVIITGDNIDHLAQIPCQGVYLRKPFGGAELRTAIFDALIKAKQA